MIQVKIAIYQEGENCIVEKDNMKQTIPSCNAMKFARTMWDKPGDKYTKEEIDYILEGEAMSFSAHEFEDAYNHRLTECQTSEEAETLKELKLWWDLLGQIINLHECKAGCSGCF